MRTRDLNEGIECRCLDCVFKRHRCPHFGYFLPPFNFLLIRTISQLSINSNLLSIVTTFSKISSFSTKIQLSLTKTGIFFLFGFPCPKIFSSSITLYLTLKYSNFLNQWLTYIVDDDEEAVMEAVMRTFK